MLKESLGQPIHLVGIGLAILSAVAVIGLTLALFQRHTLAPRLAQTGPGVAQATQPSDTPIGLTTPAPSRASTAAPRPKASPVAISIPTTTAAKAVRALATTVGRPAPPPSSAPTAKSTSPPPTARGTVSPTTLDFGSLAVSSQSLPQWVVIANDGNAPLAIGGISNPGADFRILSDPCSGTSIAPGKSCQLTIGFTPQSTGALNASLFITSNSAAFVPSVSLVGTGI